MKTKSFQEYLEKRLNKEEIAEIEEQARREVQMLRTIQQIVSTTLEEYMEKNQVGFNELVRLLDSSPSHVTKMRKGEANLTISSLAHIFAALGKEPQEVFRSKK